jgi:hypothetical protein
MTIRVDGRTLAVLRNEADRTIYFAAPDEPAASPRLPRPFELWLDPGNHVFIVSQPSSADVTKLQSFAPGASQTLVFAMPHKPPVLVTQALRREEPRPPDRTGALVSFGFGAAGFVASGVFAVLSLNLESDLKSRCSPSGACPPAEADDIDRAKRFSDYTTAGLVVGGVGAALGATLWLTAAPHRDRAAILPWVGVGSAGLTARF